MVQSAALLAGSRAGAARADRRAHRAAPGSRLATLHFVAPARTPRGKLRSNPLTRTTTAHMPALSPDPLGPPRRSRARRIALPVAIALVVALVAGRGLFLG